MVAVRGSTLRALREDVGAGRRTVARALAAARGAEGDHRAIEAARHFVLRLEQRDGQAELTSDEAEAIAAALGIDPDDLGDELLWVWRLPEGKYAALGGHLFGWSDPAEAMARRDALGVAGAPTAEVEVAPATRRMMEQVAAVPGWGPALLVDPSPEQFNALARLEALVSGDWEGHADALGETLVQLDRVLPLARVLAREADRLHALALTAPGNSGTPGLAEEIARLAEWVKRLHHYVKTVTDVRVESALDEARRSTDAD